MARFTTEDIIKEETWAYQGVREAAEEWRGEGGAQGHHQEGHGHQTNLQGRVHCSAVQCSVVCSADPYGRTLSWKKMAHCQPNIQIGLI